MVTDNGEPRPPEPHWDRPKTPGVRVDDETVWNLKAYDLIHTIAHVLEPHMSRRDVGTADLLRAGDEKDRRIKADLLRGIADFIEGKAVDIFAGG